MKTRGTRGGIVLTLEASDSAESIRQVVSENRDLFTGKVLFEVAERVEWAVVQAAGEAVAAAGGRVLELRPPGAVAANRAETVIVARTLRSGSRVDSAGAVVVIGDVNAGAEIVAEGDIIVLGTLRGLAHAGAGGNERAIIWAQAILSPQLRIGHSLAQAGEGVKGSSGPEVAHLVDGQIVLRPWER
jgi:septum site-determining protein MinC